MRPSVSLPSPLPHPRPGWAALVIVAAVVGAIGCGNGSIGDPPSTPIKDEFGHGQCPSDPSGVNCHLCNIITAATWENPAVSDCSSTCNEPPNTSVIVTGVTVVAIDTYDETMNGKSAGEIYVEDTQCNGGPFSGIQVFDPGYSPPDLRLAPGDVVDLNGLYEEYLGPTDSSCELFGACRTLPEFTGTVIFRFDSVGLPTPVEVPLADLFDYDLGRPFMGMLVTVKNVTLMTSGSNDEGRYTAQISGGTSGADIPAVANELYDIETYGPTLTAGQTFASITGILTYFYNFEIAPRSPADFVVATPDGGAPDGGM